MQIKVLLSFLPILALIFLSLKYNVKSAVVSVFVLTSVLFFFWDATPTYYVATLIAAFIATLPVIMIVFGAIFLYQVMIQTGMIHGISNSLREVHPSNEVKFFLISIGLTAFFEGVAGFGTPGAIVPPILISLGFNAVLSVAVVLLFDGLFAVFGAIGTPITVGIKQPLALDDAEVLTLSTYSALLISLVGVIFLVFIFGLYKKFNGPLKEKRIISLLFIFYSFLLILFSFFLGELSTVLSALCMLVFSILYLTKGKVNMELKPWIPYLVLVLLLVLPKIILPLFSFINVELSWKNIFSTEISASLKILNNPLIPFLMVGVGLLFVKKFKGFSIKPTISKVASVFVVLFPSIAISQMMIRSGGIQDPSMLKYISEVLSLTGSFYPIFSPFIGIIGAFISGSTTVSNIIFATSQFNTAKAINMNEIFILALQHTGAAIGNAVCLFNIIAAATVANIKDFKSILHLNILPTIIGGLVLGVIGYIILVLI